MAKYYDTGNAKFKMERTNSGYFHLTTLIDGMKFDHMFSTAEGAYEEILSYAEIDSDDFEDEMKMYNIMNSIDC